ncbi:MAG: thioesterase [Halobacteriovoraceae bacterium]|nr:thioesterase [Halobacteriovoraceae bacterium]|tara:strand:+ start:372 stop:806 length:435 start_codon:yes stop_codon:yes gene_type:complete
MKETVVQEFEYHLKIIEAHLDTFGHVNNATYLELYEEARWDFISERGFGLKDIQKKKMGPVILDLHLKFKRELKNRENIKIVSKSLPQEHPLIMHLEQKMIKENGELASSVTMSVGLMDLEKRKLIKPTAEWLHAIGFEDTSRD